MSDPQAVLCPLCDYDLRATVEPRCPECGHQFDWAELRDPTRRLHPYLFEMHPEGNAWSFSRTFIGGLNPWQFWTVLSPLQQPRPQRIILYWKICVAAIIVCSAPLIAVVAMEVGTYPSPVPLWRLMRWGRTDMTILPAVFYLIWPWATIASMMCFRVTLRAKSLRRGHILRCVLYSADAAVWLGPLLMLAGFWALLEPAPTTIRWFGLAWTNTIGPWSTLAFALLILILWIRLAVAYYCYLRIPHALATLVLSQVIVGLAFAKIAYICQGY